MKYVLLFAVVLPALSQAQSKVTGLGNYRIGITTSDSLSRTAFKEEDQSYVKGTIALPCTHIRTFTAATAKMAGTTVTNLVLVFYDNRLFRLSCDYSDSLKVAFTARHGPGVRKPVSSFQLCTRQKDKPLLLWDEIWANAAIVARVADKKGYTAECKLAESARLTIYSQPILALSSDCDIKPADPFMEEFDKAPTENQAKPRHR